MKASVVLWLVLLMPLLTFYCWRILAYFVTIALGDTNWTLALTSSCCV